jgi:hypothetical protein
MLLYVFFDFASTADEEILAICSEGRIMGRGNCLFPKMKKENITACDGGGKNDDSGYWTQYH